MVHSVEGYFFKVLDSNVKRKLLHSTEKTCQLILTYFHFFLNLCRRKLPLSVQVKLFRYYLSYQRTGSLLILFDIIERLPWDSDLDFLLLFNYR